MLWSDRGPKKSTGIRNQCKDVYLRESQGQGKLEEEGGDAGGRCTEKLEPTYLSCRMCTDARRHRYCRSTSLSRPMLPLALLLPPPSSAIMPALSLPPTLSRLPPPPPFFFPHGNQGVPGVDGADASRAPPPARQCLRCALLPPPLLLLLPSPFIALAIPVALLLLGCVVIIGLFYQVGKQLLLEN